MKHISEMISVRRSQLERVQISLFSRAAEKGSSEWSAFDAVRGDKSSAYSVRTPTKALVLKSPQHILRIIYPLRQLKGAH